MCRWFGGFVGREKIFVEFVAGAETGEEDFDRLGVGCGGRLRIGLADHFLSEVENFDWGWEIGDEEGGGVVESGCGED